MLGAADYKLSVHLPSGRGVYTFCMCPGGEVVAAATEEGGVCVNGMSQYRRTASMQTRRCWWEWGRRTLQRHAGRRGFQRSWKRTPTVWAEESPGARPGLRGIF